MYARAHILALLLAATSLEAQRGPARPLPPDSIRPRPAGRSAQRPPQPPSNARAANEALWVGLLDSLRARWKSDQSLGEYTHDAQIRVVVRSYLKSGHFDRARETIPWILDSARQREALGDVGAALVKSGQVGWGMALIDSLPPGSQPAPLLLVTEHLAAAGHLERAREAYRTWQERTRDFRGTDAAALPALRAIGDANAERELVLRIQASAASGPADSYSMKYMYDLARYGYRDVVKVQLDAWHRIASETRDRSEREMRWMRLADGYIGIGESGVALRAAINTGNARHVASTVQELADSGAAAAVLVQALPDLEGPDRKAARVEALVAVAGAFAREGNAAAADSILAAALADVGSPSDDWWAAVAAVWSLGGDSTRAARALVQLGDSVRRDGVALSTAIRLYQHAPSPARAQALVTAMNNEAIQRHRPWANAAVSALVRGGECRPALTLATRFFSLISDEELEPLVEACVLALRPRPGSP